MTAHLTSIIFDEKTKNNLLKSMAEHQDTAMALDMIDTFGDLGRDSIKLQNLQDGAYTLIIKMDLERSPAAQFTLMHAETHGVVRQTVIDITPVIETGILYHDDYLDASCGLLPGSSKAEQKEADAKIAALNNLRTAPLNNLLSPYIVNSDAFNSELLEVLDFATLCYVEDKILDDGHDPDMKSALNDPLNKNLPHSKLLH